jgi:hypothetical protein
MKNKISILLFFIISCISFLSYTRGLYVFNKTEGNVQYSGTYSGSISKNSHVNFPITPTMFSIKRASGIWIPLETLLAKMHFQKKEKADSSNGTLSGIVIINPSNITTDIGYFDAQGKRTDL